MPTDAAYSLGYATHDVPSTSSAPAPSDWGNSAAQSAADAYGSIARASTQEAEDQADLSEKAGNVISTSFRAARYNDSVMGDAAAMNDAIEQRNAAIKAETGVQLENPMSGGYDAAASERIRQESGASPDDSALSDLPSRMQGYQFDAYNQAIAATRAAHPQANPDNFKPLGAATNDVLNKTDAAAAGAVAANGGGLPSFVPQLIGGFASSLRDPVNMGLMALPVGGELKAASTFGRVVEASLRAGAVNAGIQAAQEPILQANLARRGQDYGIVPALTSVGTAGLFGAPFGAAHAILGHLLGAGHGIAPETTAAAIGGDLDAAGAIAKATPRETAPVLHASVFAEAADRAVMMHRPGVAEPTQLAAAVRDAVRAGEDPRAPLPELVPNKADPELAHGLVKDARTLGDALDALRAHPDGPASALASDTPRVVQAGRLAQLSDEALQMVRDGVITPEAAQHIPAMYPDPVDHAAAASLLRDEGARTSDQARDVLSIDSRVKTHNDAVQAILGNFGTAEPRASFASLGDLGDRSVSAQMHAPEIFDALGADVPGTIVRPFGGPLAPDGRAFSAPPAGIVAYHGTPHDFDSFSSTHIGNGEGAQAYGHGLYFAENQGIADGYRTRLSRDKIDPTGNLYQVRIERDPEHFLDWDSDINNQSAHVLDALGKIDPETLSKIDELLEERDQIPLSEGFDEYNGKRLFQILSHYDINEYLPDELPGSSWSTGYTTTEIHASAYLKSLGIAGIRYLDNVSRKEGEGTRNIVTFHDHDIVVTHKNGVALPDPTALPTFLRGEAKSAFGEEMKAAGMTSFSGALQARAEAILDRDTRLDHGRALEEAALARAPKEDVNAVDSRSAQGDGRAADGAREARADKGDGSTGTGSGLREPGQAGGASRPRAAGPQSLLGFLRAAGGLRDDAGELAGREYHKTFPGLVNNKTGISLDRAREMAAEAGYLGGDREAAVADSTVSDLMKALDSHPVYAAADTGRLVDQSSKAADRAYLASHKAATAELHEFMTAHGMDLSDSELIADAAGAMVEHRLPPAEALERAHEDAVYSDQPNDGQEHFPDGFFDGASFEGEDAFHAGEPNDRAASGGPATAREPGGRIGQDAPGDRGSGGAARSDSLLDTIPLADHEDGADVRFAHPDTLDQEAPEAILARVIEECPF